MTAELIHPSDPSPGSPQYTSWLRDRMLKFHELARQNAVNADLRMAWFLRRVDPSRAGQATWYNNEIEAQNACESDRKYKGYIGAQQMYDRWTQREAAVLQALAAYSTHGMTSPTALLPLVRPSETTMDMSIPTSRTETQPNSVPTVRGIHWRARALHPSWVMANGVFDHGYTPTPADFGSALADVPWTLESQDPNGKWHSEAHFMGMASVGIS